MPDIFKHFGTPGHRKWCVMSSLKHWLGVRLAPEEGEIMEALARNSTLQASRNEAAAGPPCPTTPPLPCHLPFEVFVSLSHPILNINVSFLFSKILFAKSRTLWVGGPGPGRGGGAVM